MLLVGVDLGGTNIKAGLVDDSGRLTGGLSVPTEADLGRDKVIENICAAAADVAAGTGWENIDGVGIGSPGPLDYKTGVIITAPNLPGWENVPLADEVASRLGAETFVENDANAACWGEYWVGAGRDCRSMVLLTLGTGIGSGIILDGRLWRGSTGAGAEIGHMVIDCDGEQCGCGNRGCLEALASAPATVRRYARMTGKDDRITADTIYKAASAGDTAARDALEETGRYLGVAVANIANVLNPEIVLFSGGLAGAADILIPVIREEVSRRAFETVTADLTIATCSLPDDAGVIGAAGCAMERLRGNE